VLIMQARICEMIRCEGGAVDSKSRRQWANIYREERFLYTFNKRTRQPPRASVVRDVQRVSCYCQCLVIWLCVGGLRGVTAAVECVRNGSLRVSLHVWWICHVQTGTCLNAALVPMPQLSRAANRASASSHHSQYLETPLFSFAGLELRLSSSLRSFWPTVMPRGSTSATTCDDQPLPRTLRRSNNRIA
jgi:hypothetical protein